MISSSTQLDRVPTERLEAEVQTLAGHLAAATCRWLLMVAELDRREAWLSWETMSMAHWLSWKCGVSLATGRDHVRVARALERLPEVRERFARGQLSFSKVRALCRLIAAPEMEHDLVELAIVSTAAQLDLIAAGYRKAHRYADPERDTKNEAERRWSVVTDDDGMSTLVVRAPSDQMAGIVAAVDAAVDNEVPDDTPAPARRVDGLAAIARHYLQPDSSEPVRTTVVCHYEVDQPEASASVPAADRDADQVTPPARLHGIPISRSALECLRCDAGHAVEQVLADGSVERSPVTQSIPNRIRRAVRRRDLNTCRWPGCTNRAHLHVHHITFRSHNGKHTISNLVLLCSHHHRRVHQGGWSLSGDANGELVLTSPDGQRLTEREAAEEARAQCCTPRQLMLRHRRQALGIDHRSIATAHGERLQLAWTVGNICDLETTRGVWKN